MPRYRRRPAQLESGGDPHIFTSPEAHYRQLYFEACDLIYNELEERFSHQHTHSIILLESLLLNAANGNAYQTYINQVKQTPYKDGVNFDDLARHLLILLDKIKKADPVINKVTSIHTNDTFKELFINF